MSPLRGRQDAVVADLAARMAPTALASSRLVPVSDRVSCLLPGGGLQRGAVVAVEGETGSGATSLALALVARATNGLGPPVAVVGGERIGWVAAGALGADLRRVAVVADPGPRLGSVVAALVEAVDVCLLIPARPVAQGEARRLLARIRESDCAVVSLGPWPDAHVRLTVSSARSVGLGEGHGVLRDFAAEVTVGGRGAAERIGRTTIGLVGPA